jgi:alpha-beta hydrolase superfamily lysophospholipase
MNHYNVTHTSSHLGTVTGLPFCKSNAQVKMKSLRLAHSGLRIAYQTWGEGNPIKVLCLHGFQDNSNSFNVLAPFLAERGRFELVAFDHVGHG